MLLTGLLFVSVVACGQAWILEATKTEVAKKLTHNITISCCDDDKNNNLKPLDSVFRIRLQKFEKGSKWKTVARIDYRNKGVNTTFADVKTSGFVGNNTNETFLAIHFDIASENSIGLFQCEVDGFDTDDDLEVIKSNQVNISDRGVSPDDLLKILLVSKSKEHTEELKLGLLEKAVRLIESKGNSRALAIAGVQKTMNAMVNKLKKNEDSSKISNGALKKTNGDFKKAIDDFKKTQRYLKKHNDDLFKLHGKLQYQLDVIGNAVGHNRPWPEGTYALLNTSSGCPNPGMVDWDWEESYAQITTQNGSTNQDKTSTQIHFSENPIGKHQGKNVFTFRFCSKSNPAGPAWPKGSYCLNSFKWYKGPASFGNGNINIGRVNSPDLDKHKNLDSFRTKAEHSAISFSCREDGDVDHPILLPSQVPFYLYRNGKKCQEVIGMNVVNEWIYLDSSNDAKNRHFGKHRPDGRLKGGRNIRMELCFYTPKP